MVLSFVAAMFALLQTKDNKVAKGTVEAEIADLLYLTIQRWREVVPAEEPYLILDNVNIQSGIPDQHIASRYGQIDLPAGHRIRIPPFSPDCNQVAEHSVAACKTEIAYEAFTEFTRGQEINPHTLQTIAKRVMQRFEKGEIYADGVRHNVHSMPVFWKELSTPEDQSWVDAKGHTHWGSGGDWVSSKRR